MSPAKIIRGWNFLRCRARQSPSPPLFPVPQKMTILWCRRSNLFSIILAASVAAFSMRCSGRVPWACASRSSFLSSVEVITVSFAVKDIFFAFLCYMIYEYRFFIKIRALKELFVVVSICYHFCFFIMSGLCFLVCSDIDV